MGDTNRDTAFPGDNISHPVASRSACWEAAVQDARMAIMEADARLATIASMNGAAPTALECALGALRAATNSARFALVQLRQSGVPLDGDARDGAAR